MILWGLGFSALAVAGLCFVPAIGRLLFGEAKADADPAFREALAQAHAEYEQERIKLVEPGTGPSPSGGVGGTRTGVKCLHAHYAHTRAGRDNPVGTIVAQWIEPLDCETPCVLAGEKNPDWVNRP